MTAIGEVVRKVSTWNPSRSSSAEPFSYVDLSSVDQDAKRITCARTTRPADAPSRARQLLERGDVLVSTVRPNLNAVAYVTDEFHGATASTGFTVLRPADRIDGRYLFHWVQSPAFVQGMVAMATGASYPAVSDRIVKESSLPLPPIEEQRRIAAILDHAAHLASMRAASLQQLDASEAAQFNALFGNLSSHGNGARPLRGLLTGIDGGRSPVCEARPRADGEYGVLKLGAVTTGTYRPLSPAASVEDEGVTSGEDVLGM